MGALIGLHSVSEASSKSEQILARHWQSDDESSPSEAEVQLGLALARALVFQKGLADSRIGESPAGSAVEAQSIAEDHIRVLESISGISEIDSARLLLLAMTRTPGL